MRNSTVQQSGEYGGVYYNDTSAHTHAGSGWNVIQMVTDTVFSTVSSNITSFPTGVTFSAGSFVYGVFTSVTLTSGSVILYNRKYA